MSFHDADEGFALSSLTPSLASLHPGIEDLDHTNMPDDDTAPLHPQHHLQPLGKPLIKKVIDSTDIGALLASIICLTAAIATVTVEPISWRLNFEKTNYQLVVVGFLLSIMNICLRAVAPTVFLLLEASFGPSTLQNYEGILRNQLLKPKLSLLWRLVFLAMQVLPIALSAAYKTYLGGSTSKNINPADYLGNQSYYGMYPPPGLQSVGRNSGISLFSNATLPFLLAISSAINGTEPPLPPFPQAYGFNHLVLDNQSAAILDIPQISYISTVQGLLLPGESWRVEASVYGTVATYNTSNQTNTTRYRSDFVDMCELALSQPVQESYTRLPLFNHYNIILVHRPSPGNQTRQYVGFTSVDDDDVASDPDDCAHIAPHMQLFDITRQHCKGVWFIGPNIVQLVDGSCNGTLLPPTQQIPVTNNNLYLGYWFLPSLAELVGEFAAGRSQSSWLIPSLASGVAAMLWSRISAIDGPAHPPQDSYWEGLNHTAESVGLAYTVRDSVSYVRPTMLKSASLYLVLAIEPVVLILLILLKTFLHSTPIDKGFGLTSVLAGLKTENLERLHGATLSGELKEEVRLMISPRKIGDESIVEYRIALDSKRIRNGKLDRREKYN